MIGFVISLPGAKARLERTEREFARYCPDVKWQVPDVCDARGWSDEEFERHYEREAARCRYGRDLCKGEVGCSLSHLAAMKAFLSSNEQVCLIVEDDVLFSPEIGRFLSIAESFMSCKRPIATILSQAAKVRYWTAHRLVSPFRLTQPIEIYGTICYMVNRSGAELMLRVNHAPVSLQADCWREYQKNGLSVRGVYPVLAGSFDFDRKDSFLAQGRRIALQESLSWDSVVGRPSFLRRLCGYAFWKVLTFLEFATGVDKSGGGGGRSNAVVYDARSREDAKDIL